MGHIQLTCTGRLVSLGGRKQRATLAVLATAAGQPVSTETLIERVWGAALPGQARGSLHAYISRLRHALDQAGCTARDVLPYRAGSYSLAIDPRLVDLHLARQHASQARLALDSGRDEAAADLLWQAVERWDSHPLGGISGEWAAAMRSALARERLGLLVQWSDVQLGLGRHFELLGQLPPMAAEHPLEEELTARIMLTLYRCGFRWEALEVYRQLRDGLVRELGIEPSENVQRLLQNILAGRDHTPLLSTAAASTRRWAR